VSHIKWQLNKEETRKKNFKFLLLSAVSFCLLFSFPFQHNCDCMIILSFCYGVEPCCGGSRAERQDAGAGCSGCGGLVPWRRQARELGQNAGMAKAAGCPRET
jgi:hypothetical protein